MSTPAPTLAALCGSLRRDSFNRKLLRHAVELARGLGAQVDEIEMRELELPPYDGDLEAEQGLPPAAHQLKARIAAAQGLLIATPEYNHSIPGGFKNAIDWATRGGNPFAGKVAALMGTATGTMGAVRSLQHLRQVLMARGCWIVPALVAIPHAAEAFNEAGHLQSPEQVKLLEAQVAALIGQL